MFLRILEGFLRFLGDFNEFFLGRISIIFRWDLETGKKVGKNFGITVKYTPLCTLMPIHTERMPFEFLNDLL